ncbi:MAG: hypothetical protein WCQ54_00925 [Clostridiaceae bacterium]
MYKYMKEQQKYVKDQLDNKNCDYIWLQEYFKAQIRFLSHERLIHLIITLFFSLLLLASIIISFICPSVLLYLLILILFILVFFYIVHYYRLENGIQSWYLIYNKIEEKLHK